MHATDQMRFRELSEESCEHEGETNMNERAARSYRPRLGAMYKSPHGGALCGSCHSGSGAWGEAVAAGDAGGKRAKAEESARQRLLRELVLANDTLAGKHSRLV